MKISMKRLAALVLALVMVVGILPAMDNSVNAVATIDFSGLTDKSIGMSVTNSTTAAASTWTGSENTVTGSLAGRAQTATLYLAATDTLTITNNKSGKAKLSFDYEISGTFRTQAAKYSYVTVDGTEYKAAATGSFSKELESGESVTIVLNVVQSRAGTNQININITKLALAIQGGSAVDATFEAPAYGSYTVAYGDQSVTVNAGTASQVITNMPNVEYTLTANPGSEYKFVGWYNVTTGKYISTQATYTCYVEEAATIKAVIVPKDAAVFLVGENYYSDLNEAVAYAQANSIVQITLVQSGTLAANENGYTIPAGITLLIPMDTAYTLTKTDDPDFGIAPEYTVTEAVTPYAFMTLTLAEGAKLTVNGTLDIESKHTALEGGSKRPYGGRPSGPYGAVYMSPNSNITMNDGSNLYAWGFVYGDGTVTANSGSKIYEIMQVTDFPGGSNMQNFVDVAPDTDLDGDGNPTNDYIKTFPFSQYYVQNIEVAVTLNAGASEYVYITMSVPSAELSMGLPVEFIGSGGMFNPTGGSIVKDYDPSTDRLVVDVNGNATMAGIALDLTGTQYADAMNKFIGTSKVDSATFILTLNGNISINVNSGTTEVRQDLHLLPGVEIAVAKDATLVIGQRTIADGEFDNLTIFQSGGYNVYVWDLENWGKYVFNKQSLVAASYSPTTGRYKRTASDLKDVVIDINGTVISNGFIYSTVTTDPETWLPVSGGAAVISTEKTGVLVLQNGAGLEEFAFCLDGSSSVDHFVEVDSVWLKNGDGTFVLTDASAAGTTFAYCDVHDLWYTEGHGDCVAAPTHVEISWIINGQAQPMEVPYNTVPVYPSTPSKAQNGCTVYTFAGWSTSANGEVLDTLPAATEETAYYAIFTESISHVGDTNNDHLCNGCNAPLSECKDDNKDHICDYAGCGDTVSECVDNNQDHICDYTGCKDELSSCVDADLDHVCDYAGCGETTSECVDADQDHVCDFAGCKDVLSECKDDNQNHVCDYVGCGETTSECVDKNQDHFCDYLGCLKTLSECVDGDDQNHNCDYTGCNKENVDGGHHGGTAYCTALAICDECGERYGSFDLTSHTGELEYTHVDEWSHKVTWSCCGAVVSEEEEHHAQDGYCVCGDVFIRIYVRKAKIFGIEMEAKSIGIFVKPGTTYTLDLAPADGWEKVCVDIWDYSTDTLKTTLNATQLVLGPEYTSAYNEDLQIDIYGYWDIVFDMNGVDLIEGVEQWYPGYDPENGIATMPMPFDAYTTFDMIKYDFVKEGYTLIGVTDGQTTYTGEEEIAPNGEDLHLTLIWKADHVCSENLTEVEAVEPDCDTNGVKAYWSCSCGKYYADANASTEIPALAAWKNGDGKIEKLGHGHTAGLYYEEDDDNHHTVYCNDCDAAIKGNVKCTDTIDDGDHKCDFCPNENITGHIYDPATHKCECDAVETFNVSIYWNSSLWIDGDAYEYGTGVYFGSLRTPEGQTFVGYAESENGEVVVAPGGMYTVTKDVTLYAVFEKNTYTLTITYKDTVQKYTLEYGEKLPAIATDPIVTEDGKYTFWYWADLDAEHIARVDELPETMPAKNLNYEAMLLYTGWKFEDGESQFWYGQLYSVTGWWCINENNEVVTDGSGSWYYFDENTYNAATGLTRVPYNTELGYGPDQEAMDYCANNGTTFIDAAEGWFVFDEDGKFQSDYTGVVIDGEYARYAVNGHIAWHVGMIENQGAYFYFTGDEVNGGNVMVAGRDYYLSRNNTELNVTIGGIYTFGVDGALCRFHGITESDLFEGKRYYVGGQLMIGAGLMDLYTVSTGITNYFYVDSKGQLIVDAEYYIGANSLGINSGIYYFDENGFMVIPEENSWNGFYNVDGTWYYYVNGEKDFCAGLISTTGILWYENANAEGVENQGWVYVRSNGALAIGAYYVTNTNGHGTIASGDLCIFDENGLMQETKSGIADGYYYEDNHIVYGAGLLQLDDGSYIYVRSNGQVVMGTKYWITKVNDTGIVPGTYEFDANGKMIIPVVDTYTGIRDGYYYENGHIAYGLGLIDIEPGKYIYVRSNGQVATGMYWITNHNDALTEGIYNFGEDGILVIE